MLIETKSSAENSTGLHANSFGMEASAAAFKIISSSLYERKEEAVIRELSANALDAHIEAGNTNIPVVIQLPSTMNPSLVIRDVGIGMSLDTVRDVLTSYFKSTKSSDNGQVGGFGLGFKSPFAISESYTVETVHKGLLTELVISLDNGQPKYLELAANAPTDLPDGTTVTVPVNRQDARDTLVQVASKLFAYWDTPPTIVGTTCTPVVKTPFFSTPHYTVPGRNWSYGRDSLESTFSEVLVGPFTYSTPSNLLRRVVSKLQDEHLADVKLFQNEVLNNYKIILNTVIGDLELAPSRERIEDTDDNFNVMHKLILEAIQSGIKDFKTQSVAAVDIIYQAIKNEKPSKYGLPSSTQAKIYQKLIDTIGTPSLVSLMISNKVTKTLDPQDKVIAITDFFDVTMSRGFSSLPREWVEYLNGSNLTGYSVALDDRQAITTLKTGNDRVARTQPYQISNALNLDANPEIFVLTKDTPLNNSEKAKINYAFRTGTANKINITLNGASHALDENNYFELSDYDYLDTFKHIIETYTDTKVIVLSYADLLPYINTPAKTRVTTNQTRKVRTEDAIVVSSENVFLNYSEFNNTAITVKALYKDRVYAGLDVVFYVKQRNANYSSTVNAARAYCKKTPTVIIEITQKEFETKRCTKFIEDNKVKVFKYDSSIYDVASYFLKNDYAKVRELVLLDNLVGHVNVEVVPTKYSYLYKKYEMSIVISRLLCMSRDIDIGLHNLFVNDSKEHHIFKAALNRYSNNLSLSTKLAPASTKKVIKTLLSHIETLPKK